MQSGLFLCPSQSCVSLYCRRKEEKENMPVPKEMRETFDEIKAISSKMEMLYESSRERQEIWEKLISEQTANNKERLELIDKRWGNLMKIVVVLTGIFLMSFIRDTVAINNRPTTEEVGLMIDKEDIASKRDVMRGADSMIDDIYDTFARETDMTHDEAHVEGENVKMNTNRKITDYNPRSVTNGN